MTDIKQKVTIHVISNGFVFRGNVLEETETTIKIIDSKTNRIFDFPKVQVYIERIVEDVNGTRSN